MAYTDIDDPTIYFNTVLYTGNGGTQSITGVGFTQDFTWIKSRSTAQNHYAFDTVRGAQKQLYPSTNSAEDTGQSNGLNAFTSDGFNLGTEVGVNGNGATFASWNWKAGTSFSNSAGANGADLASAGSYNRDAGFSIVTWTGNATDDQQIYHGLNAVPQMMLVKNRTNSNNESWKVYHQAIGNTHALTLDTTAAKSDNVEWWSDETPTSTVFTVGRQDATNNNSMIAYCFAPKQGYSKFGSYVGNGSENGSYIHLGFKPAWLMVFHSTAGNENWMLVDNKRDGYNVENEQLFPNTNGAEESNNEVDLLSNGFKLRRNNTRMNGSGATYIYMAFAENPFVTSTGVPATAR